MSPIPIILLVKSIHELNNIGFTDFLIIEPSVYTIPSQELKKSSCHVLYQIVQRHRLFISFPVQEGRGKHVN